MVTAAPPDGGIGLTVGALGDTSVRQSDLQVKRERERE